MFRRSASTDEPRFLKDLLQALRDSEEELALEEAAATEPVLPEAVFTAPLGELDLLDLAEMDTIREEIAVLRERSAEWKEAVRIDREQSCFLVDLQLAA